MIWVFLSELRVMIMLQRVHQNSFKGLTPRNKVNAQCILSSSKFIWQIGVTRDCESLNMGARIKLVASEKVSNALNFWAISPVLSSYHIFHIFCVYLSLYIFESINVASTFYIIFVLHGFSWKYWGINKSKLCFNHFKDVWQAS